MADEKDIKNQQDLNNEKRQTANIDKDINSEQEKSISLEDQLIQILAKRRGITSGIFSDQQDINNVLADQIKQQKFQVVQNQIIKSNSAAVTKIATEAYSITKDQLGLTSLNADITKNQESLTKSILILEQQKEQLLSSINDGSAENVELNKDIADSITAQVSQANKVRGELDKIAGKSKEISDNLGVKSFAGLSEISKAIPGLSKFSGPFEEASEAARSQAASNMDMFGTAKKISKADLQSMKTGKGFSAEKIKSLGLEGKLIGKNGKSLTGAAAAAKAKTLGITKAAGGAMSPMMAGFKALGPMLKKALGPIGLIIEAVQAFVQIDKQSGEVAKSMGISAKEARNMNAEMADAAAMSGDLLVSSKDVVAANMELNKIFGTSVQMSGELASEFASIKERTGLSGHAMEVFAEKALLSGTSITKQLEKVSAVTMELSAQTGIMLNAKDIQEGIGEMSKTQMLNNQMNTKEMAKQVFQAKLLGVSQSQLENIQGSLLDFESSIAAEMEAELLTGKQLNLEGARAAALAGDQAKLATELRKEVGTAAEFGKMNVIQQEAMAKAFGMSREDMAGMLIEQEKLEAVKSAGFKSASDAQEQYNKALKDGTLTEELKGKLAKAGVLSQMESATAQDKMNAAMDKFSDLFVQLVDPLMPIIDALMAILEPIFAILSPIAKLIGDLVGLIMNALMPGLNYIQSTFAGISKIFTGLFNLDFDMVLDGFKTIGNGAISFFNAIKSTLIDILLSPLDGAINLLNLIPGVDIPDASTALNSVTNIPQMAEGGIVTSPTQAIIGEGSEPEAVLPLSKLADMLPSGAGLFGNSDIGASLVEAAGSVITAPMKGITDVVGNLFSGESGGIGGIVSSIFGGDETSTGSSQTQQESTNNAEMITLLKDILVAVKEGGDVYIDGAKAGRSMALATSRIG